MTITKLTIIELNTRYIHCTGLKSTLDLAGFREHQWFCWWNYADPHWTREDLELVINYIRNQIRLERGFSINSLAFSRLIGDPPRFEELLGIAKAEARIKPTTPRQEMLKANGRPEPEPDTVRTPAQVMSESLKMASMLKAWKEQNL